MKHLFIVNPIAGGKDSTDEVRQKVSEIFDESADVEVYVTRAPLDAVDKIKAEAAKGDELRVYACGGDGTFNECVCGAALLENVAVCPYPTGTGNDFCRMFGDESDLYRDLRALVNGSVHPIDLIECNGRYSANICSVGIDARIGTQVHKYTGIPVIGGAGGYVISAVVNLLRGITTRMHVTAADYDDDGEHTMVCVCNGRYYGGGFHPSLDARPDDGDLDIYIVRRVNLLQAIGCIGKYSKGRSDELPDRLVRHLHGDRVHITFDTEQVVNIDGEALFSKDVTMQLVPKALKLIVPEGMKFFD